MTTMVDAWGPSAHCEVCDQEADEAELSDDGSGREVCNHCRQVQNDMSGFLGPTDRTKEQSDG